MEACSVEKSAKTMFLHVFVPYRSKIHMKKNQSHIVLVGNWVKCLIKWEIIDYLNYFEFDVCRSWRQCVSNVHLWAPNTTHAECKWKTLTLEVLQIVDNLSLHEELNVHGIRALSVIVVSTCVGNVWIEWDCIYLKQSHETHA